MSPNFLPPKQAYFPDFVDEADIEEKKSAPLKWKLGTRVLPVFVFSVLQVSPKHNDIHGQRIRYRPLM